jgi:hypothetical protein
MKYFITLFFLLMANIPLQAQETRPARTRLVLGLAGPELIHAGVTYRLADFSQLGLNAGIGPSSGMAWTAISLEHRLYLGKASPKSNLKTWFFRQGTTFFPSATLPSQRFTLTLTGGKDIPFRNAKNGISIDLGVFYLADSERSSLILVRSLDLWPALRFQFYFSL